MQSSCKIFDGLGRQIPKPKVGRGWEDVFEKADWANLKKFVRSREQERKVCSHVHIRAPGRRDFRPLLGLWKEWHFLVSIWCQLCFYQRKWYPDWHGEVEWYSLCISLCKIVGNWKFWLPLLQKIQARKQLYWWHWRRKGLLALYLAKSQKKDY